MIDFDSPIDRLGTCSVKHDGAPNYFGTADLLPLWVADMDFPAPEAVTRALTRRASHPVYGYTFYPDEMYQSLIDWLKKRHGWSVEREWIVMAPGVVPSLYAAVTAFAAAGQGVVVQPPVYFPFFSAVSDTKRQLIENPLKESSGRYQIDFEHLEECAKRARMLIFCSPHNPVGRLWSKEELERVVDIARRHDLVLLSDEIHADLVYPGNRHISLGTLDAGENLIVAVAPSKTFNIPGMGLSALIAPNPAHRAALQKVFATLHLSQSNPFSIAAFQAAYAEGEPWLDRLLEYLRGTRDLVERHFAEKMPQIKPVHPEATYLMWLDCHGLGMSDEELANFFVHRARVGMNPGAVFGKGGSGYMRLNLASPRQVIFEALQRIELALKSR